MKNFDDIDLLIRVGKIKEAAQELSQVKLAQLSRLEAVIVAGLLRRVGRSDLALQTLAPYIRPRKVLLSPATSREKAEYSICLQRLGSFQEAAELSAQIAPAEAPEILLYQAIGAFSRWDYEGGQTHLSHLIDDFSDTIPPYLLLAAKVNLASAWAFLGDLERARCELKELIAETHRNNFLLLECNCLELLSQCEILSGNFAAAAQILDQAERLLSGVKTIDRLFLIKWRAILEALERGSAQPLEIAQAEAQRKGHSETLRDLDYFRLKVDFSEAVALKLYFGTPFSNFRRRLRNQFPDWQPPGEVWILDN